MLRRFKRASITAALAATALSLAVPLAGTASAAPKPTGPVLLGSTPAAPGVSSLPASPRVESDSNQPSSMLSVRVTDPAAAAKSRAPGDASTDAEGGGYYCTEWIDTFTWPVGEDDYLEETVRVDYGAEMECNFYLASVEAIAGVLDRSESFNGEDFDGDVLGTGTYYYSEWDYQAFSVGAIGVPAREYNGARHVEAAFELFLLAPEGIIWDACNPVPGLRYLVCEGLGTDYLHVVMGTGPFGTGLTRACRNQQAPVDAEQVRVRLPAGQTPASTQLIRRVPSVKNDVTSFKRALCSVGSAAEAGPFARAWGERLWGTATAAARRGEAAGDDRPLYWARLSMTHALEQWRPRFGGVDRTVLQFTLDEAGRGMTTHSFGSSAKKIFLSGFDPFELQPGRPGDNIFNGNPSGAAALQLDGTVVGGAEVQAVVFPVRFFDFNQGLVERIFRPHLAPGDQQATLITTVSQGGSPVQFDLEVYNGRRRSSTAPDNQNMPGGGSEANPVVPAGMGPGAEFVETTLPVHKMRVGGPYQVVINRSLCEYPPGAGLACHTNGPTPGSISVRGSGGGYLSNEIAYRVTRLRDELVVGRPAGHVHTPRPASPGGASDGAYDTARTNIVNQLRSMLGAANPIDSPRAFVAQHYRDFLGREADGPGLDFWTREITQCGYEDAACIERKQVDVSMAFWYSTEFVDARPGLRNPPGTSPDFNNAEFVRQAYLVYLRREPDPEGHAFWLDSLNRNNDYWHLAKAFLVSIDYRNRFGA